MSLRIQDITINEAVNESILEIIFNGIDQMVIKEPVAISDVTEIC